jgi:RNA polymerase sigma-B factor
MGPALAREARSANDGHERRVRYKGMPSENSRKLSDHEIHGLLREYKSSRSQVIRDRVVMQYTNLVESVARRFAGAAEPTEDLVQEGYIGLITAVDGYNADKGVKFSTYATHFVIGQIKHHLRDRGKIIKEPAWLQELNQKVTRVIESLSQELGRVPTNGEIAKMMGMPEETIAELLTTREVFKVASLDGGSEQDDDNPTTYDMDRVKADRAVEFQLPLEEKVVLETALQKLKDLEQTVIQEFYFRDKNQTEIARELGISCNYVSHILRNSTKKLKKIMVTDELKEAQMELTLMRRRIEEQAHIIEEQTVVDPSTRLYNRRYFDSRLEEELSRASRHQYPLSVVLVNLDGIENVSRAYGTIRGEEATRQAAELIRGGVRRVDIVTRFDNSTYALVLPHTGSHAVIVAERLGKILGKWLQESGLAEGRAPVSVNIGYGCYPGDAADAQSLAERALQEMRPYSLPEEPRKAA